MEYLEYIHSAAWRERRNRVVRRVGCCQRCYRKHHLHVHHLSYANLGKEPGADLLVLCNVCHSGLHDESLRVRVVSSESPEIKAQTTITEAMWKVYTETDHRAMIQMRNEARAEIVNEVQT